MQELKVTGLVNLFIGSVVLEKDYKGLQVKSPKEMKKFKDPLRDEI